MMVMSEDGGWGGEEAPWEEGLRLLARLIIRKLREEDEASLRRP